MWGSRYFTAEFWTAFYFSATGGAAPSAVPCDVDQSTLLSNAPFNSSTFLTAIADSTTLITDLVDQTTFLSDNPTDSTTLLTDKVDSTTTLCKV